VLILILLGGAILVRLVGDEDLVPTTAVANPSTDIASGEDAASPVSSPQVAPRRGQIAPDFTLLDLEGQPVSLSEWQGRPVLINFWATWCGPCKIEMPVIQAAYKDHQEDGLMVLAVAVDDSAKNVRRFFEEHSLTFQPLMDDGEVSRAYQVFGLPTSFFVRPDGIITDVHAGMLTEGKIEENLARVLYQD
jgi:peroxiredoxin